MRDTVPEAIKVYVRYVDALNKKIGKLSMYLVFIMMGILLYASIARTIFDTPLLWAVEMSQFTMAAYYMLGGAFSMYLGAHVRMDVLYGNWSPKKRATVDVFTVLCLIFYLAVLLAGGVSSTLYSLEYGQHNYSAWAPPVAPIKIIMVIGIFLMLLQSIATFFKDIAKMKGVTLS
jgi:TRAP-type mannitol/chloroaromatic compound transport system permease small subunit